MYPASRGQRSEMIPLRFRHSGRGRAGTLLSRPLLHPTLAGAHILWGIRQRPAEVTTSATWGGCWCTGPGCCRLKRGGQGERNNHLKACRSGRGRVGPLRACLLLCPVPRATWQTVLVHCRGYWGLVANDRCDQPAHHMLPAGNAGARSDIWCLMACTTCTDPDSSTSGLQCPCCDGAPGLSACSACDVLGHAGPCL